MTSIRSQRWWAFAGLIALALTIALASHWSPRRASMGAEEDLRDALADTRPTASLAGKPVPTTWFKTPEAARAEIDDALYASRRRRAISK